MAVSPPAMKAARLALRPFIHPFASSPEPSRIEGSTSTDTESFNHLELSMPLSLEKFPHTQTPGLNYVYHISSDFGSSWYSLRWTPASIACGWLELRSGRAEFAQVLYRLWVLPRGKLGLGCRLLQGGTVSQQRDPTAWVSPFMRQAWHMGLKVRQKLSEFGCSQLGYQLFTGVAGNAGCPHLETMEAREVAYTQLLPLDGRRETLFPANLLPSSLGEETLGTFSGQYSLLSTLLFFVLLDRWALPMVGGSIREKEDAEGFLRLQQASLSLLPRRSSPVGCVSWATPCTIKAM